MPILPDIKKSSRLQVLDRGMINYFVGIQKQILGTKDLNSIYQGTMIEHLMGQELLAFQDQALSSLHFWVREKKESSAEVDYLIFKSQLIPVEVKFGTEGKLKSLHLFMDMVPHKMAIRFYAGERSISEAIISLSKKYYLINLLYYLGSQVENYLKWFQRAIGELV